MLRCLGQSPPWSRWEGGSDQQGFSLPVYNWSDIFRKDFFGFPFGSPLLASWHRGQAAVGKLWTGLEVWGRRNLLCLLLLVHTRRLQRKPGWEQAGNENYFFGSPSCVC